MRNIGGTYDLADQLPSNREFGHFLVVSQSQVPREFGVNLALHDRFWRLNEVVELVDFNGE